MVASHAAGRKQAMLELKSLKKHFGAIKVIEGVDLLVQRGEILGILGPNGAGKSTLFNLIYRSSFLARLHAASSQARVRC